VTLADEVTLLEDALSALVVAQHVNRLVPSEAHEDLVRKAKREHVQIRTRLLAQASAGLPEERKSRLFRKMQHLETYAHTWLRAEILSELAHTAASAEEEHEAGARYHHRKMLFLDALRGSEGDGS